VKVIFIIAGGSQVSTWQCWYPSQAHSAITIRAESNSGNSVYNITSHFWACRRYRWSVS